MPRNISENGLHFTAAWEKFREKPYYATEEEREKGIITWGYGHTGKPSQAPAAITEEEALALLNSDMAKAVRKADELTSQRFTQSQFDAICDLCFNVGTGVIEKDAVLGDFDDAVRTGNVAETRRIMAQFIYQGKKPLLGLRRRTAGRLALFDGMLWQQAEKVGRDVK